MFVSSVMQYIYKRLGIKIETISPYNHGALKSEGYIITISEIIRKKTAYWIKVYTLFANLYLCIH